MAFCNLLLRSSVPLKLLLLLLKRALDMIAQFTYSIFCRPICGIRRILGPRARAGCTKQHGHRPDSLSPHHNYLSGPLKPCILHDNKVVSQMNPDKPQKFRVIQRRFWDSHDFDRSSSDSVLRAA